MSWTNDAISITTDSIRAWLACDTNGTRAFLH